MKKILVAAFAAMSLTASPVGATEWRCPKWHKLALDVGFKRSDLKTLDYILWRESRCSKSARGLNKRADGSVWSTDLGLTQINNYSWVTYLRNLGIIKHSEDLLHPRTNLRAAKALYDYSKSKGYSPWHQWRISSSTYRG